MSMIARIAYPLLLAFSCLLEGTLPQSSVPDQSNRSEQLSNLTATKEALKNGDFNAALISIKTLRQETSANDPLQLELAFLEGIVHFQRGEFTEAAPLFLQSLPKIEPERVAWHDEAVYLSAWSLLQQTIDSSLKEEELRLLFDEAENRFRRLSNNSSNEKAQLGLGECLLLKGQCLKDVNALRKGHGLLSRQDVLLSQEGRALAFLLRARATPEEEPRYQLYQRLTADPMLDPKTKARAWYFRGISEYEDGILLLSMDQEEGAARFFAKAQESLSKAFELLLPIEPEKAIEALKSQAIAMVRLEKNDFEKTNGEQLLESLLNRKEWLDHLTHPDETFLLTAWVARQKGRPFEKIESILRKGLNQYPEGKFSGDLRFQLGLLALEQQAYAEAELQLNEILTLEPTHPYAGEALFWKAYSQEKQGEDPLIVRRIREQVYQKYPSSTLADEAYFLVYPYAVYLEGDRAALKHLKELATLFPRSRFLLHAHYLQGLNALKDRRAPDGRWIARRDLIAAAEAFADVETSFQLLYPQNSIPLEDLAYPSEIRYRAAIERARVNLLIGGESSGAKKQIHLDYAEELFRKISSEFAANEDPAIKALLIRDTFPLLAQEADFWLAKTLQARGDEKESEDVLLETTSKYQKAKISRNYYLSRIWYEIGQISMRQNNFGSALNALKSAEESGKGYLSTDERLDLWLQQAACRLERDETDQAILLMSRVVNDEAISGLRLKAMYLRASAYERQGRPELARKQLEALSKKGGEWSLQAKIKLREIYGYP